MLFQIVAAYGRPKILADNQKLQPGCPWDNPFYSLNSDTALRYSEATVSGVTVHTVAAEYPQRYSSLQYTQGYCIIMKPT